VRKRTLTAALILAALILGAIAVRFYTDSEEGKGPGEQLKKKTEEKLDRFNYPLAFVDIIEAASTEYGVPKEIICAVILAESSFEPDARSHAEAVGLMQITPIANEDICARTGMDINDDLYDPEVNIRRGTYFLSYLYRQFGDYSVAFAAYNAGYGNVKKWLGDKNYSSDGKTLDFIPFEETRNYVERVTEAVTKYKELYFSNEKEN